MKKHAWIKTDRTEDGKRKTVICFEGYTEEEANDVMELIRDILSIRATVVELTND